MVGAPPGPRPTRRRYAMPRECFNRSHLSGSCLGITLFLRAPALASALVLAACQAESASFTLGIQPVLAPNQGSLLSEMSQIWVELEDPSGTTTPYEIESTASGTSSRLEGIPIPPDDIVVNIKGFTIATTDPASQEGISDMGAWGRSIPVAISDGYDDTVDVYVAGIDRMATFNSMDEPSYGAALASDGNGTFYSFGGTTAGTWDDPASDSILSWTLVPPTENFTFQQVGTLPSTYPDRDDDNEGATFTGRMNMTATLLEHGSHSDLGKILLTGGWNTFWNSYATSRQALLFDPETLTIEEITPMEAGRAMHQAVLLDTGEVIFFGGYDSSSDPESTYSGPLNISVSVEVYQPTNRTFSYATIPDATPTVLGASASMGNAALYCGGMYVDNGLTSLEWGAIPDCMSVNGFLEVQKENDLEYPTMLQAMAPLPDGSILMSGGIEFQDGETVPDITVVQASNKSWIFDGSSWTRTTEDMHEPRASHVMVALPDGRIVVAGGSSSISWYGEDTADPLSTVEIFDPGDGDPKDGTWTLLESVALPTGTSCMSHTTDPDYGIFIYGGLDSTENSVQHFALYSPNPLLGS